MSPIFTLRSLFAIPISLRSGGQHNVGRAMEAQSEDCSVVVQIITFPIRRSSSVTDGRSKEFSQLRKTMKEISRQNGWVRTVSDRDMHHLDRIHLFIQWSSRTHAQDFSHTYAMSKCFRHIKGVDFHDIQATTYTLNGTLSCDQPTELLIFHFPALPPLPPPPYTGPSNEPVLTIRNPSTPSLQNGPLIPQSSDHAQQQLAPLVTAFTPVEQAETGPHTQSVTYNDLIRHNIRSLIHGPAVSSLHPPSPPREQGQTYVVLLQWTSVEAMQIAREQEERGINEAVRRVKENVPGLEVEEGMCLGFRDWKGEGGRGCAMM